MVRIGEGEGERLCGRKRERRRDRVSRRRRFVRRREEEAGWMLVGVGMVVVQGFLEKKMGMLVRG